MVSSTSITFIWAQTRSDLVDYYQISYSYKGNCNTSQLQPSQRGGNQSVNGSGAPVATIIDNLIPYSPYLVTIAAVNSIGSSDTASKMIITAPASKLNVHVVYT